MNLHNPWSRASLELFCVRKNIEGPGLVLTERYRRPTARRITAAVAVLSLAVTSSLAFAYGSSHADTPVTPLAFQKSSPTANFSKPGDKITWNFSATNNTSSTLAAVGVTFTPGIYVDASAFSLTGTMTLDCQSNPNGSFVFLIKGAITTAAASHIALINGCTAANVT